MSNIINSVATLVELLNPREASDIFEVINKPVKNTPTIFDKPNAGSIFEVLNTYAREKFGFGPGGEEINWNDYFFNQMFLQYPNRRIKELAETIISPGDSNDEKAYKITKWVVENIVYRTDSDNYGWSELWVPPVMTVVKGSGDCEDGAFLIHSLLLNAGVPWTRVRTYGGEVWAGDGAPTGGHAWTAYRRESDNEWVILDSSYFPNRLPVSKRMLMTDDERYIDDWFYMDLFHFIVATSFNYVREPDGYNLLGYGQNRKIAGLFLNMRA